MFAPSNTYKIYLATAPIDFRKGMDGLSGDGSWYPELLSPLQITAADETATIGAKRYCALEDKQALNSSLRHEDQACECGSRA